MGTSLSMVLVLIVYLFFVFSIVFNVKVTNKQYYFVNCIFLISVILLAYNFIPPQEYDLYRYWTYLDYIENFDWNTISSNNAFYTTEPLTNIYFYIMRTIENKSLVATIPTALIFIIIIYVSTRFRKNYNYSFRSYSLFIVAIISIASLTGIISGIRQNFAWAVLMIAIYYDFFKEKTNNILIIIMYIIPLLIHNSTLIVIIIRLFVYIFKKYNIIKYLKFLIILWPVLINVLLNFVDYLPDIFADILGDYSLYSELEYDLGLTFILKICVYLILIYFVFSLENNVILHNERTKEFKEFYITVVLFSATSIMIPTLFTRMLVFCMYISLPLFNMIFKKYTRKYSIVILLLLAIFVFFFYIQDRVLLFGF